MLQLFTLHRLKYQSNQIKEDRQAVQWGRGEINLKHFFPENRKGREERDLGDLSVYGAITLKWIQKKGMKV